MRSHWLSNVLIKSRHLFARVSPTLFSCSPLVLVSLAAVIGVDTQRLWGEHCVTTLITAVKETTHIRMKNIEQKIVILFYLISPTDGLCINLKS